MKQITGLYKTSDCDLHFLLPIVFSRNSGMCIFKQEKGAQISCKPSGLAQGKSCPFLSIKPSTMPAERLLSTLEEALSTWLPSFKSPAEATT